MDEEVPVKLHLGLCMCVYLTKFPKADIPSHLVLLAWLMLILLSSCM